MLSIEQRAYRRIEHFLKTQDFNGFTSKDLFIMAFIKKGWGQDIAALSNIAEAILLRKNAGLLPADIARDMVSKTLARALHNKVSPYRRPIGEERKLGRHGYYLEHLNIILGIFCICGGRVDDELDLRVSKHLRDLSLAEKNAHAPLMPRVKMRWSADQAAILKSLWLCDKNHSTDLHREPAEKWLDYMKTHMTHAETGLFETDPMRAKRYSRQPRGCSLSYMIHYMTCFAGSAAQNQWDLYKKHMQTSFLCLHGYREYLPEYKGKWTPDSGPIIGGIGVAATGLGLKAATSIGDLAERERLKSSIDKVLSVCWMLRPVPGLGILAGLGTDVLAAGIYLNSL